MKASTAPPSTSRSLLAQLINDPSNGWERLTALYAPLVYRWCRQFGLPEQDTPDVFQQVFQAVASNIQGFEKDRPGGTFRGWLRVITRNKVRDHFRKKDRQPQAVGGTDAQIYFAQVIDPLRDDEESADLEDFQQLLRTALEITKARVNPQTWQAFWKVVVENKTPEEVAEELGMRPGTVRVAKSRVLSHLRTELGE